MSSTTFTRAGNSAPQADQQRILMSHHAGVGAPATLPADFLDGIPKLDHLQSGHLRHFHNLASQADGDWSRMGSQEPAQEFLDAYRYQLATMAYAAGAAHFHRLPALRSVFQPLMQKLIKKFLRREVWGYWYLTSQSGKFVDPDIESLRQPWADPIRRENIMYSGHLLLMVSLYSMLFDNDDYDEDNALSFKWDPIFYGMGAETFNYSRKTLQKTILDEMEKNNWLGSCCEPNSIFVVCNQFPLIAIRYNDVRNGTNEIEGILEKYKSAWAEKGMVAENGLLVDWYRPKQDDFVNPKNVGFTAWAGAFMNAWNPDAVQAAYPSQALGFITRSGPDLIRVNLPPIAHAIRKLVTEEGADPHSQEMFTKAERIAAAAAPTPKPPFKQPTFGYIAKWLSEIGDAKSLDGLLNHADRHLNPTWEKGGLYYPRNDEQSDASGHWTHVDPFTGNAAIGYARLNIPNGQRQMWLHPWKAEDMISRPFIDGIDMESGIDFLRGAWLESLSSFVLTMKTWDATSVRIVPVFRNLPVGSYAVYVDGGFREVKNVGHDANSVSIELSIGGQETSIVVRKLD